MLGEAVHGLSNCPPLNGQCRGLCVCVAGAGVEVGEECRRDCNRAPKILLLSNS